jgi:hypothetical protein
LWWFRSMLNFCDIVMAILKMATARNFSISGISSGHYYLPTYQITIPQKIQHCTKSSQFDMWVDNDVQKWVPTLNNFYWLPFSKWPPQYHKNSTLSDIIKICILKMATGRNCSMSRINSGHHYLPTYQIVMISVNVEFLRYCDGHFENSRHWKLIGG